MPRKLERAFHSPALVAAQAAKDQTPLPLDRLAESVKGNYKGINQHKRAGRGGRTLQKELRDLLIAHDAVFGQMSNFELGKKYGMSESGVAFIRRQDKIKALEELWTQQMFDAHRMMGVEALSATLDLLRARDATIVKDYWHRMGISREPQLDVKVQELKLEVPLNVQQLLEGVFKQLPAAPEAADAAEPVPDSEG